MASELKGNNTVLKGLLVLLFVLGLGIVVYFWAVQSGELLSGSRGEMFTSLGRLASLVGVYLILIQLLLIGRIAWIERVFGHDRLSIFHHLNGFLAWGFIFVHPALITLGYASMSNVPILKQFTLFLTSYEGLVAALTAIIVFDVAIITSIGAISKRLKYEYWLIVHALMYAAIFLAFDHQLELGGDFSSQLFTGYWYFLYIFVVGNLVIFRIGVPAYTSYTQGYRVEKVVKENSKVNSVYIKGKNAKNLKIRPGQFMIFRFLQKGFWTQAHPFSVSSAETSDGIRISVKNVGDFTSTIPEIKEGTPVIIEGPYGKFTSDSREKDKFLLVAGGIGVTPLRSIFEEVSGKNKDVVLLYSNRTEEEITFKKELDEIAKKKNAKVAYIVTHDQKWKGLSKRIDGEMIKEKVPDFAEREIYVCGPTEMNKSIRRQLKDMGVPDKQIHSERFSLG